MILLADENFPRPAVEALRKAGVDVMWIAELNPGAPDDEVLAFATSRQRTLLTFDKDFGETRVPPKIACAVRDRTLPAHSAKPR